MKREAAISLSIAVFSLTFCLPKDIQARTPASLPDAQSARLAAEQSEATRMVPAEATLLKNLDARKAKLGQQFRATLSDKVQLKNGTELPRGTVLIGTVSADKMQTRGTSSLALRFTQANLKNGTTIPIKAMIVSVCSPDSRDAEDPNIWTARTFQIDQEDAMSGVDLHSRVAGENSGVFVSTKKDDVKLPRGFDIALAIAAAS